MKNLYEAISDEDDRELRAGLTQKAKEYSLQLAQSESALLDLKQDLEKTSNVIDISGVMEFIRVFRDGAFDAQPVATQAEILKNRIRRIVVREDGLYVEIYQRNSERILSRSGDGFKKENSGISSDPIRSGVRTVFKLVDLTGIEPATC